MRGVGLDDSASERVADLDRLAGFGAVGAVCKEGVGEKRDTPEKPEKPKKFAVQESDNKRTILITYNHVQK